MQRCTEVELQYSQWQLVGLDTGEWLAWFDAVDQKDLSRFRCKSTALTGAVRTTNVKAGSIG